MTSISLLFVTQGETNGTSLSCSWLHLNGVSFQLKNHRWKLHNLPLKNPLGEHQKCRRTIQESENASGIGFASMGLNERILTNTNTKKGAISRFFCWWGCYSKVPWRKPQKGKRHTKLNSAIESIVLEHGSRMYIGWTPEGNALYLWDPSSQL